MPPSRRRIPAAQRPTPTRRPKVAGLRKPSPTKRVPEPTEETGSPAETTSEAEEAVEPRPERAPESVSSDASAPAPSEDEGPRETESDRPRPRPKTRDRGTVRPTDTEEAGGSDENAAATTSRALRGSADESAEPDSEGAAAAPRSRRTGYPVLAALLAATLVLAGLAVFFKTKYDEVTRLTGNTAMVDVAATAEVKQAMEDAAQRLFSVNYQNMEATKEAADAAKANEEVRSTYDALMGDYRREAQKQKIVVTTTAVRSAVVLLDGDRARVMVYVDQVATRAGQDQPMGGPAAMWFEAERRDGTWKVAGLDVYGADQPDTRSGTAPTGAETPSSQAEDLTEGN